jgi:hypothetical protein
MWPLELFSSGMFGYQFLAAMTSPHWGLLHHVGCGIPVGFVCLGWFVFLTSSTSPMTIIHGLLSVLLFSMLSLFLHLRNRKRTISYEIRLDYFQKWTFVFCGLFATMTMYFSMLYDGKSTRGAASSDLPFHLSLISSMAHGRSYDRRRGLWTPFYANESLAYPILPNYISAVLIVTGRATIRGSLFLPSLLVFWSLLLSVYCFSRYYTSSSIGASISVFLFLGLGRLG